MGWSCQKKLIGASRSCHSNSRTVNWGGSLLLKIFGKAGDTVWLQSPFFCDFGSKIELGERVYFDFNCTVLDVCKVIIGDYCLL
jgi:acetyltransferase-like isoleucine patch superfamily enzyme